MFSSGGLGGDAGNFSFQQFNGNNWTIIPINVTKSGESGKAGKNATLCKSEAVNVSINSNEYMILIFSVVNSNFTKIQKIQNDKCRPIFTMRANPIKIVHLPKSDMKQTIEYYREFLNEIQISEKRYGFMRILNEILPQLENLKRKILKKKF